MPGPRYVMLSACMIVYQRKQKKEKRVAEHEPMTRTDCHSVKFPFKCHVLKLKLMSNQVQLFLALFNN